MVGTTAPPRVVEFYVNYYYEVVVVDGLTVVVLGALRSHFGGNLTAFLLAGYKSSYASSYKAAAKCKQVSSADSSPLA